MPSPPEGMVICPLHGPSALSICAPSFPLLSLEPDWDLRGGGRGAGSPETGRTSNGSYPSLSKGLGTQRKAPLSQRANRPQGAEGKAGTARERGRAAAQESPPRAPPGPPAICIPMVHHENTASRRLSSSPTGICPSLAAWCPLDIHCLCKFHARRANG